MLQEMAHLHASNEQRGRRVIFRFWKEFAESSVSKPTLLLRYEKELTHTLSKKIKYFLYESDNASYSVYLYRVRDQ